MKKCALFILANLMLCSFAMAKENDAYACDSKNQNRRGVPAANLIVHKDSRVGHTLSVSLGEDLPTTYICRKTEGRIDRDSYAAYDCHNGVINKSAALSINKNNLSARLDLEANDSSFDMICELNPVLRR